MDIARALKDRVISPLASRTINSDRDGTGMTAVKANVTVYQLER